MFQFIISFLKKNLVQKIGGMNTLYILLSLVIFAIAAYFIYTHLLTGNGRYTENFDNDKQAEIMFFYADWCPHCKTAKPIWKEVKDEYETKAVNGYHVIFTEIDCTANDNPETAKLMDKYNVEGFPTIKLLKDGKIINFDAKLTKENIIQFLNTML